MEIGGCRFPDDLLYEPEGLVWLRPLAAGVVTVGVTSIMVGLTGKVASVRPKPAGERYEAGRVVATIESPRHFAAIRAPADAVLVRSNPRVLETPRVISADPYGDCWVLELRSDTPVIENESLTAPPGARGRLEAQIGALRVRCFAAVPDYEMFEIGTECSAVLAHLDDLLDKSATDEVVHVVSDDPTAPIEMVRWQRETGHTLLETRREGNLYHFIVRKVAPGARNAMSQAPR